MTDVTSGRRPDEARHTCSLAFGSLICQGSLMVQESAISVMVLRFSA
jgi:hypothetical protein